MKYFYSFAVVYNATHTISYYTFWFVLRSESLLYVFGYCVKKGLSNLAWLVFVFSVEFVWLGAKPRFTLLTSMSFSIKPHCVILFCSSLYSILALILVPENYESLVVQMLIKYRTSFFTHMYSVFMYNAELPHVYMNLFGVV